MSPWLLLLLRMPLGKQSDWNLGLRTLLYPNLAFPFVKDPLLQLTNLL